MNTKEVNSREDQQRQRREHNKNYIKIWHKVPNQNKNKQHKNANRGSRENKKKIIRKIDKWSQKENKNKWQGTKSE